MASQYDVVLDRVFDAPREVVWKAWTDPAQFQQWWGPGGFSNPVFRADVRTGGQMYVEMRAPTGAVYPMIATFLEVVEMERIVFKSAALDEHGQPNFEIHTSVTFSDDEGKTAIRLEAKVLAMVSGDAEKRVSGMGLGWSQSLARLAELLTTGSVTL